MLGRYQATERQIAEQAEKFRNHHQAKGSLMADWSAAWRTWWGYDFHKVPRREPAYGSASPAAGKSLQPYWWRDNPAAPKAFKRSTWQRLIDSHANPWSMEMLGPPPNALGCVIPSDVLSELRVSLSGSSHS